MPLKSSFALRCYALFVALWMFFLVVAGGAVAEWGLGDIPLVHSHQGMGATAGILTLVLAAWLWRAGDLTLRRAGLIALSLVILQGVLGALSMSLEWPATMAVAHACLGQLVFSWLGCTAWMVQTSDRYETGAPLNTEAQKMYRIAATTTGFVLLQLLAGAVYHFTGKALHFHFLGALLVVVHGILVLKRAFTSITLTPVIRLWACILNGLISAQLILGFFSWRFPTPDVVTAHLAVGALILASSLIITVQSTRRAV